MTLDEFGYAAARAAAMSELLVAAQQAGVEVTPELRAQIEGLAEDYAKAEAAQNQLDDAQDGALDRAEEWADLRADTTQGLVQDLLDGVSAADAFASALGRVGDQLISMALNDVFSGGGGGGGGNILGAIGSAIGGLFGGARAGGGPVSGGKSYIVGEHGPELFRPWHASGPNPIAFSQILAWSQLMRWPLEPHHVRLLLGLDHVWLDDAMRRRGGGEEGKPEAVTRETSGPITPAAFDVMFGGPPGGVR